MASKHFLKLSGINAFFGNDNKMITKGENALESNHVKKMQFDAELLMIKGEILASMKEKSYIVEITLDKAGDIISASCACPRGIKCHHIATLALFGHYNISVTDKACTWNVPSTKSVSVKTAEELYPPKPYEAIEGTLSKEAKMTLKTKLSTFGNTVGFSWILRDEPQQSDFSDLPIIEEILSSNEFILSTNKVVTFIKMCEINVDHIKHIATITKGQVMNEKWFLIRKFRLTASNFGVVLSACRRNKYSDSLFKTLIGAYNLDGIKSIQWGRTHEKEGLGYIKNQFKIEIVPTGIWLTKSGFLGASPDGLVGEDAIVEIKCPYTYRNDLLSEKLKNNKKYIVFFNDKGDIEVNKTHHYYHQIQGNLHILKRQKCYLCIWTLKEILTTFIEYDQSWEENLIILENFYVHNYLPKLLEK